MDQGQRFSAALNARRDEIELFWKRSLFFWGFIAAALVALATSYHDHPRLALGVTVFGTVCSLCWTLANRGSRRWHVHWEKMVQVEQKPIIGDLFGIRAKGEQGDFWLQARPYSVGKLTIALSDFVLCFWIGVLSYQVFSLVHHLAGAWEWRDIALATWVVFGLIYAGLVLWKARSSHPEEKNSDG